MKQTFPSLCALTTILLFWACSKSNSPLQTPLTGRAAYVSPLILPVDTLPLNGRHIQIKDSATGTIYDLITDSAGGFFLPAWSSGKTYQIETSWEQTDADESKVIYAIKTTLRGAELQNARILATPDTSRYRALLVTVTDIFGGHIPGAKVLIYTARSIAALDTAFVGTGAFAVLTSNNYGRCMAMQFLSDSIFVKSEYPFSSTIKLRSEILAIKPIHQYTATSVIVH